MAGLADVARTTPVTLKPLSALVHVTLQLPRA
jgi:hypothetical protein